jgi:methylated-DNA-[protein]-cysteine S-methyltransferase
MLVERSRSRATANCVIYYTQVTSPLGPLLLTAVGGALTGLYMSEHRHGPAVVPPPGAASSADFWLADDIAQPFAEAKAQLAAYFAGRLTTFDLPLAPVGTSFQGRVWAALRAIPYGTTLSSGELARHVGVPNGARAVGLANGRNPISIIVPCHRVIGANGHLIGYGGGLTRKAALLDFEASVLRTGPGPFPIQTDTATRGHPDGGIFIA